MALQTSGPISLNDIAAEFGGTVPHALYEYYSAAAGIPSSGTISIDDFYGASAAAPATATGGSITTSGDYKYHTFTSGGTFSITSAGSGTGFDSIDVIVVAGGGGGGYFTGGGGGAGGALRTALSATNTASWSVSIGAGGLMADRGNPWAVPSTNGGNSSISSGGTTHTAIGGGRGALADIHGPSSGGSGGGAGSYYSWRTGASGTSGQGFKGGDHFSSLNRDFAGGGGGAGAQGQGNVAYPNQARGGHGHQWLNGTYYAGGGAGGTEYYNALGGAGGGGSNSSPDAWFYGGGGSGDSNKPSTQVGNGYQGIVIFRYKYQ